ncbi:MAG: tyrosine-type recombinase/integrase [Methanogenium sp.]|nr:tyrosine-type recombinase/integrase [Methanogenium sp.]
MPQNAFHSTAEQYRTYEKKSLSKAIEDGRVSASDTKYIREFLAEVNTQNNLSAQRKFKLMSNLTNVFQHLPPVEKITIADLYDAVEGIKGSTNRRTGKPYTKNTQNDLLRILKRFATWLVENKYSDMDLLKIKKIKIPAYLSKTKTDDSILTEEEAKAVIETPHSLRYRALLGVLYEGGFRIQEIADMRWSDIRFTQWGARIRTAGKTEKERHVPIIMYREFLSQWQTEHPDPRADNYVFLNYHNAPLKYQSISKNIQKFCRDAGIERKITPHIFRHSRVTHVLRRGMQETLCKKTFWGNENTDMLKVYSHLTADDAEAAFAKMAGVEIPEETVTGAMEPAQCHQCHHINPPGSRFCARCGMALAPEAIEDYDKAISFVENIFTNLPDSERLEIMAELTRSAKRQ